MISKISQNCLFADNNGVAAPVARLGAGLPRPGARPRRRGIAMIYSIAAMAVLMGFTSFAVDVGHVMLVNTELQRASDAGARAGAGCLSNNQGSSVTSKATTVAGENYVDGVLISGTSATITVQYIDWISSGNYTVLSSSSGANAVKVTVSYPVSMMFAALFNMKTHTAAKSSIAAVVTNTETTYVSAYSNPWLAGMPTGTTGSLPDSGYVNNGASQEHPYGYDLAGPPGTYAASGQPYSSPVEASIPIIPGATISVSNVSGNAVNDLDQNDDYSANGSINGYADAGGVYVNEAADGLGVSGEGDEVDTGSENHIANSYMPLNSLNGVFLTNAEPDTQTAPAVTNFSTTAEQNYTTFNPLSQQVFYIGNGQTSTEQTQSFTVPTNATRLFLGTMDGHEWSNNLGGYTVTITETSIQLVQ